MTYDDYAHHAYRHDGCGSLALLRHLLLRQPAWQRLLHLQGLVGYRQSVACAPAQHRLLLDLPSCLRAADLEVRCLVQPDFHEEDEVPEAGLAEGTDQVLRFVRFGRSDQLHPQHVSCCDCVHRAYRDDASSLRPEFLEYVADQTVVRCPVAARG